MKQYEENWNEALLDGLIAFLNLLPEPAVKMVNPRRYREMMEAAANLKQVLTAEYDSGEIGIRIDNKFLLGGVSVEMDDLSVSNVPLFLKVLSAADAFEVYPLTNGKLRVDLTFQGVLKAVC